MLICELQQSLGLMTNTGEVGIKEARSCRIFDMWLACYTQQEIADAVGIPRKTPDDIIGENGKLADLAKHPQLDTNHATDFDVPIKREVRPSFH
ncbi:hypothetical protein ACFL6U_26665, partial [Planctomycetota bacterium]